MKEMVNILIERMDYCTYADYCKMIHIVLWNL